MTPPCHFCDTLAHLPAEDVVWQFPHSVALLGAWQYHTGSCILVSRTHATELHQLGAAERHGYLDEMTLLAQAIERAFAPRKMNYELLGNQVPHLHWHLFPRRPDDPDALWPVWLALDRAERDEAEKRRLQTGPLPRPDIARLLRQHIENLLAEKA